MLEGVDVLEVLEGTKVCTSSTLMALIALAALGGACANPREDVDITSRSIEQVLEAHTDSIVTRPGVVGTAIGLCDGTPCIRVFVADSASGQRAGIPARLEGYPVRVEVTGPVRPRDPPPPPSSAAQ